MGFLDKVKGSATWLKASKNAWGTAITSTGSGTIGPKNLLNNKNHEVLITTGEGKEVVFTKTDVDYIKLLAATSDWVKYVIRLKNGFESIVTMFAKPENPKMSYESNALLNFEWWMFDVIYR